MNRDTRTISRQELEGQRAYTTDDMIYLWLYPLNISIEDNGSPSDAIPETSMSVDTKRISGQPLIDELRKRGWTVTEEATADEAAKAEPSKPDTAEAIDQHEIEQKQIDRVRKAVADALVDAEKDIKQMNEINHKAKVEPSKPDLAKAIDSQLFELVKAMVTGCAATDHPHLELSVVSVASSLLAEMRGGG